MFSFDMFNSWQGTPLGSLALILALALVVFVSWKAVDLAWWIGGKIKRRHQLLKTERYIRKNSEALQEMLANAGIHNVVSLEIDGTTYKFYDLGAESPAKVVAALDEVAVEKLEVSPIVFPKGTLDQGTIRSVARVGAKMLDLTRHTGDADCICAKCWVKKQAPGVAAVAAVRICVVSTSNLMRSATLGASVRCVLHIEVKHD